MKRFDIWVHVVCAVLGVCAMGAGCAWGVKVLAEPLCDWLELGTGWLIVCSVVVCASVLWTGYAIAKALMDLDFSEE